MSLKQEAHEKWSYKVPREATNMQVEEGRVTGIKFEPINKRVNYSDAM